MVCGRLKRGGKEDAVEGKNMMKKIAILISPLLLFAVLFLPYCWLNSAVIVDVFGCGCPQVNEAGEIIHPTFNANDFTLLFWLFISVCVTAISVFLSIRTIPSDKKRRRVIYVVGMFAVSLLISYRFLQLMMWN